jgi:hypothetical protein
MDHFVGALGEPGYFVWEATVTDMAGNMASVKRDWAVDEVNIPVFNGMVLGQLQYNAGQPGLFTIYGRDDFEVGEVQVSMSYPTDLGHDGAVDVFELVYPPHAVDPNQSPWDMDYPFDFIAPYQYYAGLLDQGIIGRIDFTTATGTTVADFNTLGTGENYEFLPTNVTGWIASDILGNGPSLDSETLAFIDYVFGGWGNSTAAPWPAPGAGTIIEEWKLWDTGTAADPFELLAQHKAPNSVFNQGSWEAGLGQ